MSRIHCHRCERIQGSLKRRSFFLPGSKPQYAPDIPFRMQHILIDVEIDPLAKTVAGFTTQRVKTVSPQQKKISLDQISITIEGAWIDGKKVPFEIDGEKVHLILDSVFPKGPDVDHEFEYKIQFKKTNPRRGLYFTGPDESYPGKRLQVWSQGQDEDNRFWFPTYDYPNQKATSEVIAKVPKGFTAVSFSLSLRNTTCDLFDFFGGG
jgi:aminopeptidase N